MARHYRSAQVEIPDGAVVDPTTLFEAIKKASRGGALGMTKQNRR